jgi:hypothetical protein
MKDIANLLFEAAHRPEETADRNRKKDCRSHRSNRLGYMVAQKLC